MMHPSRLTVSTALLAFACLILAAGPTTAPVDKGSGDKDAGEKKSGSGFVGGGFGKPLVGQPAPAFMAKTIDGPDVDLSKEKGNVVLMDFWATWCPPCKKSLPYAQALSDDPDLKSKGLKVWAVDCTTMSKETEDKARAYVKEQGFKFIVPLDADGSAGKNFNISIIPVTLVIGRDGIVKNMFVGFGEGSEIKIKEAVEQALKQETPAKSS